MEESCDMYLYLWDEAAGCEHYPKTNNQRGDQSLVLRD